MHKVNPVHEVTEVCGGKIFVKQANYSMKWNI